MKNQLKNKTPQRYRNSSKSLKQKRKKQNTLHSNTFIQGYSPQRPSRKQSVSLFNSKSILKTKNNKTKSKFKSKSKSKQSHMTQQHYTPSKQNDDIRCLVRPKFNKKYLKIEQQATAPFIQAAKQLIQKELISQAIKILESGLLINSKSNIINYFLAMCYLINDDFIKAIKLFKQQLIHNPNKNLFVFLAICYKKLSQYETALELLNNCIQKDAKFYDGFVERGRLFMKLRKFDKANQDFEQAILINENKSIAYILKGDCLRKNNKFELALKMYRKAEKIKKSDNLTLRKVFCGIQLGQFEQTLVELNKVLSQNPKNPQFLFAKAIYYKKKQQYFQAYDYFNMSLYNNSSKHISSKCLYQMGKIKLIKKDYYKALELVTKFSDVQILKNKQIQRLKKLLEGIICLLKQQYQKAIKTFQSIPDQYGITQSLSYLFYSCKSYGHMLLKQFQEARIDLLKLQRYETLQSSNLYNKYICEGILSWNQRKCEQALAYFSKASKVVINKIQPFYYKAITLVEFILSSNQNDKRKQYTNNALKIIKRQENPTKHQTDLLLIKSILEFCAKNYKNAEKDISTVLRKSNGTPIQFYVKGLLVGIREEYFQAIKYFDVALEGGGAKQYPEIYLNRAKCYILLANQKKALSDLQEYVSHRIIEPDIHHHAAEFLFSIGAYDDAAKAYSNISDIKRNKQILFKRYCCHVSSFNFQSALNDIDLLLIIEDDKLLRFDKKVIQILLKSIQCLKRSGKNIQLTIFEHQESIKSLKEFKNKFPSFGRIFHQFDYHVVKGVIYFYCQQYDKAKSNFHKALAIQNHLHKNSEFTVLNETKSIKSKYYNNSYLHLNLAISQLMTSSIVKALGELKLFTEKVHDDVIRKQVIVLVDLLKKQLLESKNKNSYEGKRFQFIPFSLDNKLCSLFPHVIPDLENKIVTHLYFNIPEISLGALKVCFDQKILNTLNLNWIKIRPEASWFPQHIEWGKSLKGIEERIQEMSESDQNENSQVQGQEDSFEQESFQSIQYQEPSKAKKRASYQTAINLKRQLEQKEYKKQLMKHNNFDLDEFYQHKRQLQQQKIRNIQSNQIDKDKQVILKRQEEQQHQRQREMENRHKILKQKAQKQQKFQMSKIQRQKQYQEQKRAYKQKEQQIKRRQLQREQQEQLEQEQEQEQQIEKKIPFDSKKISEQLKFSSEFEERFKKVFGKKQK